MELYKQHRPANLDDLIGNAGTIDAIKGKIASGDLPHFILLSGPSGCGKTTIARILKKMLKCNDMDFYEINCANNNGVDMAREVERQYRMKSLRGGCRIWLFDEAHKLTAACAESMLKPLEDTPDHVYFVFATTAPEKILKTIRTRATEYKVAALNDTQLRGLIAKVCKAEDIKAPSEIVDQICANSGGSARLALVLLDKIRGLSRDHMADAVDQATKVEAQAYELLKVLFGWDKGGWIACCDILGRLDQDAEGVRRYILAAARTQLINREKPRGWPQAFHILNCFEQDFFTTGDAGLARACYDAIKGEGNAL